MKLYPREWVALQFSLLKCHLPNTPTGLAECTRACLARWAVMSAVPLCMSAEFKSRDTRISSLDATASAQDDSSTGVLIPKSEDKETTLFILLLKTLCRNEQLKELLFRQTSELMLLCV